MPDFDVDFCSERRHEVIEYVIQKYGVDHVAQIVAFGTMAAKGAIRDVGRAMSIPYAVCDKVSKLIPNDLGITIDRALKISDGFKKLYDEDEKIHELVEIARKIEGMPRHTTTHAAGVVITENPVSDYVPLAKNDEAVVTQFTMTTLDELGLLKMDFLGLKNLTVIDNAQNMIRKKNKDFSIESIPADDKEVFEMYSSGDTEGVFQFESMGMKKVLVQLKPENTEDIIAVISLYRPGPMDSIPKYIENRRYPERVTYKHPLLRPILEVTYGCIVYQEQVMQIFRSLAGYSLGRADIVRRAMSKKKKSVMEHEKQVFIYGLDDEDGNITVDGCVRRGVPENTAREIFAEMESFASYAFNKSHAACYAVISYQTAYLKCHYPCEYFAALLTGVLSSPGKISVYIDECVKHNINVLPPDVNKSDVGFTVDENEIRFGLMAIKSIGKNLIELIIRERKSGEYTSFFDFCKRLYGKDLNRRALESLIRSGALDGIGANRRQMLNSCEKFLQYLDGMKNDNIEGQLDLFGMSEAESSFSEEPELPIVDEFSARDLLEMEKSVIGIYVSGHPLSGYDEIITKMNMDRLNDITDDEENNYPDEKRVDIIAIIEKVRLKTTKNNQRMAFVTVQDKYASLEMLVFPDILSEFGVMLIEGSIVRIIGDVSRREDEEPKILCRKIMYAPNSLNDAKSSESQEGLKSSSAKKKNSHSSRVGLYIRVPNEKSREYIRAKQIIDIFDGNTPLYIYFTDINKLRCAPRSMFVMPNKVMLEELKRRIGDSNVALVE